MTSHVYVGGLSRETTEDALRTHFSKDGRTVKKATIVTDHGAGRPRGFAFLEMGSEAEATAAIELLHGSELDGRTIKVNVARERRTRGGGTSGYSSGGGESYGGGGFGGRGGGGGGYGGGGGRGRR